MTLVADPAEDQEIKQISQARAVLDELMARTDNPSVYQAVRLADMNLHLAAWQLAATTSIMPELEQMPELDQ